MKRYIKKIVNDELEHYDIHSVIRKGTAEWIADEVISKLEMDDVSDELIDAICADVFYKVADKFKGRPLF